MPSSNSCCLGAFFSDAPAVVREPFSDPDWVFEPKYDGFRALAYIDGHHCQRVSRRGNVFKSWPYFARNSRTL
jgi:ATP-dependent DNA ligase